MSKALATPPFLAWVRIRLPLSKTTAPCFWNSSIALDMPTIERVASCHQPFRIALAHRADFLERAAGRHIAVDEIVRRGLVGDDVRHDAARSDLRIDVGGVAEEPDRQRPLLGLRLADHAERLRRACRPWRRDSRSPCACRCAFSSTSTQRIAASAMRAGERLRAAHAAEPGGQHEAAGQVAAEMPLGDAHEDLVGALDDALGADILPVAGGQPAPADQVLALQFVELLGLGPLADHVAIRHDHDRRLGMGLEHADRLAGLHQQRLALVHRLQRLDDACHARASRGRRGRARHRRRDCRGPRRPPAHFPAGAAGPPAASRWQRSWPPDVTENVRFIGDVPSTAAHSR